MQQWVYILLMADIISNTELCIYSSLVASICREDMVSRMMWALVILHHHRIFFLPLLVFGSICSNILVIYQIQRNLLNLLVVA